MRATSSKSRGEDWISKTVEIGVSPDVIYRAVSTAEGLRGWWAKSLKVEKGSEGVLELSFAGGAHIWRIRFAKGMVPARAEWDVLEQRPLSEMNGTKLVFDIKKEGPGGSKLRFQHVGLDPRCDCYKDTNAAWDYLMGSLKDLLEKGKGGPA
jgi:uncharacterized protein YndB with AHSA1/START domain